MKRFQSPATNGDRRLPSHLIRFACHLLFAAMLAGCQVAEAPSAALKRLLEEQHRRYPLLQIEDAYKLIYQGTLGIEHLLSDTIAAQQYLEQEWNSLAGAEDEPLLEIISPDSQWVRLNLRPYKAKGGTTESLWRAMWRSAAVHGDRGLLRSRWQEFVRLAEAGALPYDVAHTRQVDHRIAAADYPAIHHSDLYVETYRPAYRVLLRSVAARLLLGNRTDHAEVF